jgi:hypothetical protein
MANPESKGGQAIARKMEQIEPGTPRYEALDVARKFKTSWVELGGKLWEVRNKKWFKEWGFSKFEDYCREELKIKPRTAAKLTASYGFLKNEEPSVLRRDGIKKPVPDMQVVDMLRRVREKEQVPEREFNKIKELVFEDAPAADIRRELKQHRPDPEPPSRSKVIKQLLGQAHRLADNLAAVTGIPHAIIDRALALVDDLRSLVDPNGD